MKVQEYATYLAEPEWITTGYHFEVVGVDPTTGSFMVSMQFADASIQPESAQGELLRAGYASRNGSLALSWVQPEGKGSKLPVAEARRVLGHNFFSLELPASPFSGGQSERADVPQLGGIQTNRVALGKDQRATFTEHAPWWVSYSKGKHLKAEIMSFRR